MNYDASEFYLEMNELLYFWFQEQPEEKRESIKEIMNSLDCPVLLELFTEYPYVIASGNRSAGES